MVFWVMLFTFLIVVFITPTVANTFLAGRRLLVIRAAVERGQPLDAALLDAAPARPWRLHPRLLLIGGVISICIALGMAGMALVMMPQSMGKLVLAQGVVWFALGVGLMIAQRIQGKPDQTVP